ncbi:IclR family transcriptional regulator [Herbiconiux sp. KACC 21604]|uniref:IclR family transcriptional regulator n=1 Tax=unclassified Herbiconiux TaxID=2618217 RepID=UPI001492C258|nr:IclR family transcriptional regulator [Herbiconiux sp. SALV-R1]QJU54711.1 IclR family transcriptional regulator [Herbiconiux sp. SALV-R1]WPO85815.1 IclR family transcriptional regulator [Herbiconiux sp. KACC 21604]
MAEAVQGAQLVSRVSRVLKVVSEFPDGVTASAVAHATGFTRPTTHRLLSSLAAEGFVDHDTAHGRWFLGPELYLLGSLAADRYDITDAARESVRILARETGESAFFSARRGNETVCLLREEGSFPVRSFVLYEGVRFPLGVASAGLAILTFLGDDEIDGYLEASAPALEERWGPQHAPDALRSRIAATRETGYAVNPALILEGSWGMGAAVFDAAGRPAWALSLTGIESRFRPDRRPELGRLLLDQAHTITRRLSAPR